MLTRRKSFFQTRSTSFACAALLIATVISAPFQNTTWADGPVRVEVVKIDNGWQLLRGGKPWFIKGVGGDASKQLLVQYGGNTFRTWGAEHLTTELDEAQKLGLTVIAGMWLGHKPQGFDYHNPEQVKAQLEKCRETVRQYRNAPALLIWAIGNEMEDDEPPTDPAVWRAIEDIAAMIKKEDPNHPTMTVIAEMVDGKTPLFNQYCPDVDIIGINAYATASTVGERYRKAGGAKPFVITELGPPGQWETKKTSWRAVPELTSTEKTEWYRKSYVQGVVGEKNLCLGSCAFLWGFKSEASPTWYGMFLSDGTKVAAVDTMSELWTGKPVPNPCPRINSFKLANGDGRVGPGAVVHAQLDASSANADPITVTWELQRDVHHGAEEGAANVSAFPEAIANATDKGVEVKMPADAGGYRLYAYVHTAHSGSAVANLCLFVESPATKPAKTAGP
jgi:glycosyl hydrolase family 2